MSATRRNLHVVTAADDPSDFDDTPTFVGVPPPLDPAPMTSEVRVNTRRRWSLDRTPSPPQAKETAFYGAAVARAPKPDVSWSSPGEEITRIEVPVPPQSAPEPGRSDPTVPGAARLRFAALRQQPPIRIAMGIAVVVIAVFGLVASQRTHAPAAPASKATSASSTSARPALPVAVAVSMGDPSPVTPAIVAPSTGDETAAVDAVESGNLARAAALYAALAAAHPTNEAYREAARILLESSKDSRR